MGAGRGALLGGIIGGPLGVIAGGTIGGLASKLRDSGFKNDQSGLPCAGLVLRFMLALPERPLRLIVLRRRSFS